MPVPHWTGDAKADPNMTANIVKIINVKVLLNLVYILDLLNTVGPKCLKLLLSSHSRSNPNNIGNRPGGGIGVILFERSLIAAEHLLLYLPNM